MKKEYLEPSLDTIIVPQFSLCDGSPSGPAIPDGDTPLGPPSNVAGRKLYV